MKVVQGSVLTVLVCNNRLIVDTSAKMMNNNSVAQLSSKQNHWQIPHALNLLPVTCI